MAHQVAWSPRAIEDLEAIAQYIAADSSAYARNGREDNSQYYA
jgi:plasmid stabilization system protein ParE